MNPSLEQLENGTPKDKIIKLKSVYKTGKARIQPVADGRGWYKGVERLSEDEKKKRTYWAEKDSKLLVKDGIEFDLNKDEDKVTWNWAKHSSIIAMSEEECQMSPVAEFYVYVEEEEAQEDVARYETKYKALDHIMQDSPINYEQRVLLLGIDMSGASPTVIKQYLLSIAETAPEKIIRIYEAHDISLRLLLLKAIKNKIVVVDGSGMYRYGNTIMGMSENTTISWMGDSDHKEIVEMMDRETNPTLYEDKEIASIQPSQTTTKKTTTKK